MMEVIHCKAKVPILSFFTGGGFLDLGFEKTGCYEIVWTNEVNQDFVKLYEHGYTCWRKKNGMSPLPARIHNNHSAIELSHSLILEEAFGAIKPDFFGMIGGPPCQDFSSGGKNAGFNGIKGNLTKIYVDLILKIQPSFFIIENVQGVYKTKKHRGILDPLLDSLKKDYVTSKWKLDALEFGVPQHRHRLFVVGLLKNSLTENALTQLDNSWFYPPKPVYENALLSFQWPKKNIFGDHGLAKPEGIPTELFVESCLINEDERRTLPNANDMFKAYSQRFYEVEEGDTSKKSFKRLHRYRYSPTACYGNNEVHLHPFEPRRLSLREAMRIQGIPDEYELPEGSSLTIKFKLIGNGVPVPLAYNIAQHLIVIFRDNAKFFVNSNN